MYKRQKYCHIPLYAVLVCLIFFAVKKGDNEFPVILASACYASMLGVLDEVHHGIHAERYFGWKDMVINLIGSAIGAILIMTVRNIKPTRIFKAVDKVFLGNSAPCC